MQAFIRNRISFIGQACEHIQMIWLQFHIALKLHTYK